MSVFLNIGRYGPFIKVNNDAKFYNVKHYVDVTKINLEAAISRGQARFFHLFQLFFPSFFGLGFRVRV